MADGVERDDEELDEVWKGRGLNDELTLDDLWRLARAESFDLPAELVAFLKQGDAQPETPPPQGALTVQAFMGLVASARRARSPGRRREQSREAWQRFLTQAEPPPPPRFQLGDLLIALGESASPGARRALLASLAVVPFRYGAWRGVKRLYKLAEERLDAELFGLLAWRFDVTTSGQSGVEVSEGTLVYLKRRSWRFLRRLGVELPELYPQFAAQVLRHYQPGTNFNSVWVANHIWAHGSKRYNARSFSSSMPPSDMVKHRAFGDAWKGAPESLMYVLETCQVDPPAAFAIQGLQKDFPEKLRAATPEWLGRLAHRPLGSAHEFLVETLRASPELHQGKLRAIGLHEAVLALLKSPSKVARAYAVEYARAHATDLDKERLAELVASSDKEVSGFALALLQARPPRELGVAFFGRLLEAQAAQAWASKALGESFDRAEVPLPFLVDMLFGVRRQFDWAKGYLEKSYEPAELGPAFWAGVLDDERSKREYQVRQHALTQLGKFAVSTIGVDWLLKALTREDIGSTVGQWLRKATVLPGLDVERVKGLVFHPSYRETALAVLGNTKLVKPRELGLPWLLALARRSDQQLHEFAHRYLLEHMRPDDFGDGDKAAGLDRLFALATGPKEPEPVRQFAQAYLRSHHPVIGPAQPEAKQISLKPQLPRSAFTPERLWPALGDERPDVRRFAAAIVRADLRHWGWQKRVYELAESDAKEVRNIAYDALLKAGEAGADAQSTLTPDEIEADKVFALTESRKRSTREVGLEVIRRHYVRLGAAERLPWLLESGDREVRQAAIRLLWEKHRPVPYPEGWAPRGDGKAAGGEDKARAGDGKRRLDDPSVLFGVVRRVLFGLPPGRSAEAPDGATARRRVPASVAKRNVIDVVRDYGVENAAFAEAVAPVLGEFTGSLAKGEWQACLAALARWRAAHPGINLGEVFA
jgi:hypothetical protein